MPVQFSRTIEKVERILVCGGRDVTDWKWVWDKLDELHKSFGFTVVIDGDARGADRIAGEWAKDRGIENIKFPANWIEHGRAAGPIRNAKMLVNGKPDMVVAFAGGKGTADMISRAEKSGVDWVRYSRRGD